MKSSLLRELLLISNSYSPYNSYAPRWVRTRVSKYTPHYGKNAAERNRLKHSRLFQPQTKPEVQHD